MTTGRVTIGDEVYTVERDGLYRTIRDEQGARVGEVFMLGPDVYQPPDAPSKEVWEAWLAACAEAGVEP